MPRPRTRVRLLLPGNGHPARPGPDPSVGSCPTTWNVAPCYGASGQRSGTASTCHSKTRELALSAALCLCPCWSDATVAELRRFGARLRAGASTPPASRAKAGREGGSPEAFIVVQRRVRFPKRPLPTKPRSFPYENALPRTKGRTSDLFIKASWMHYIMPRQGGMSTAATHKDRAVLFGHPFFLFYLSAPTRFFGDPIYPYRSPKILLFFHQTSRGCYTYVRE